MMMPDGVKNSPATGLAEGLLQVGLGRCTESPLARLSAAIRWACSRTERYARDSTQNIRRMACAFAENDRRVCLFFVLCRCVGKSSLGRFGDVGHSHRTDSRTLPGKLQQSNHVGHARRDVRYRGFEMARRPEESGKFPRNPPCGLQAKGIPVCESRWRKRVCRESPPKDLADAGDGLY